MYVFRYTHKYIYTFGTQINISFLQTLLGKTTRRLRAIVLVPTHDLASQVINLVYGGVFSLVGRFVCLVLS